MSVAIASVILVATTVAVALAVSAWLGAISVNSMEIEEFWVSDITYQGTSGDSDNQITLTLRNPGSIPVTVIKAKVTGNSVDIITDVNVTINVGGTQTVTLNNIGWIALSKYQFDFLSTRGNTFTATDTA